GGRIYYYSHQKFVGCLEAKSGKVLWTTTDPDLLKAIGEHKPAQNPGDGFASTSYVKCSDKALYFAGPTRRNLVAVSTAHCSIPSAATSWCCARTQCTDWGVTALASSSSR